MDGMLVGESFRIAIAGNQRFIDLLTVAMLHVVVNAKFQVEFDEAVACTVRIGVTMDGSMCGCRHFCTNTTSFQGHCVIAGTCILCLMSKIFTTHQSVHNRQ